MTFFRLLQLLLQLIYCIIHVSLPALNESTTLIKSMQVINLKIITLLHKFPLFFINPLPEFIKCIHHILFCHLSLISHFTLFLFKPLFLQGKFVAFLSNLSRQLLKRLANLWERFLKQNTVMSFVLSMDYTFTADWRYLALEAKVRNLFIRMILARVSHLSVGLISHRNIAGALFRWLSKVVVHLPP